MITDYNDDTKNLKRFNLIFHFLIDLIKRV